MSRPRNRAKRFYKYLLRLYPAEFRSEFGTEMQRHFADEYREAESTGSKRRYLLRALVDVLVTAPAELARGLAQDLRHAWRLYLRNPVNSAIAVGVLGIGMAFVGAFLSLYVDLALKPISGVEDSGRLVTIAQVNDVQSMTVPFDFVQRIRDEIPAVEATTGINDSYQFVTDEISANAGERLRIEYVTDGFTETLKPKLALGRSFEATEHGADAEAVILISDRLWRDRFDGRRDVLGETMLIYPPAQDGVEPDPREFRIIGVTAPELPGLFSDETDLWMPIERFVPLANGYEDDYWIMPPDTHVYAIARLRAGASARWLRREIVARYPEANDGFGRIRGFRIDVADSVVADVDTYRAAQSQLQFFLAGSLLLAFVAAANVSLFLLARAPGRRRELAIRLSVGAPMRRLARQLISEAGLLVVVAALLGLAGSIWLASALQGMAVFREANWSNVTLLDWRVLGLVGCFLLIITLLVSLAPVLGLKRLGIASSSGRIAARASPAQRLAGIVQIAIAGSLGGAAIAFIWFLGSMMFGYPGYETEGRYSVNFLSRAFYEGNSGTNAFVEAARNRQIIEAVPGIDAITFSGMVPGQNLASQINVLDPADPSREHSPLYGTIDGRFVDVLGLRLVQGRAPRIDEFGVSLVNESLAQMLYGHTDVVGETLQLGETNYAPRSPATTSEIVGVLADVPFRHPAAGADPMLLMSRQPGPANIFSTIIHAKLAPADLQRELDGLIESGAIEFSGIGGIVPLADFRGRRLAPDRARALLTIGTAALVVLLAALGTYGTQRYLVAAGRREYAIRAALGAGPKALARLVFERGLMLSLPGLVLGALLAFILVTWLRDNYLSAEVLPGVVSVAVVIALILLLLAASFGPAREARNTRPAPLLRED